MNNSKLGFGFMRLPLKEENQPSNIDYKKVNKLVDTYINGGGNYFDTGYNYHEQNSETAIRKCVIERYPREQVRIADKMPIYSMTLNDNPEEIFQSQLDKCGVTYFDYYLVHNTAEIFYQGVCKKLNIFSFLKRMKEEGKIRKIGISHHDTPETLETVLNENPEIEFVQLQLNYLDWTNTAVRAKECFEIVRKHDLDVIVMEPLKGGTLAQVPQSTEKLFMEYNNKSPIQWAFSYLLNMEGIDVILSGMNTETQIRENIQTFNEFKPLTQDELDIISKARELLNDAIEIPCTYCDYCAKQCPKNIPISKYFSIYNDAKQAVIKQMLQSLYYNNYAMQYAKASECIECGACEKVCPQHINITEELKNVVNELEK